MKESNTNIWIVLDMGLIEKISYKYLYQTGERSEHSAFLVHTFWERSNTNIIIGLLGKDSLRKQVKCGTSQVYTTRCSKKGGVIGEPWFPMLIIIRQIVLDTPLNAFLDIRFDQVLYLGTIEISLIRCVCNTSFG